MPLQPDIRLRLTEKRTLQRTIQRTAFAMCSDHTAGGDRLHLICTTSAAHRQREPIRQRTLHRADAAFGPKLHPLADRLIDQRGIQRITADTKRRFRERGAPLGPIRRGKAHSMQVHRVMLMQHIQKAGVCEQCSAFRRQKFSTDLMARVRSGFQQQHIMPLLRQCDRGMGASQPSTDNGHISHGRAPSSAALVAFR